MSNVKDGLSPSNDEQENRVRDFERLLGRFDLTLSCEELKEFLFVRNKRKDLESPGVLLDVREEWEHRFVRFPDSLFIPLSRLPLKLHEIPKDRMVIAYCHTGIRSLLACYLLAQNGFDNLRNLEGGIDAYSQRIDSRLPRYRLEPGRRPPQSLIREFSRTEREKNAHPWGEGVSKENF